MRQKAKKYFLNCQTSHWTRLTRVRKTWFWKSRVTAQDDICLKLQNVRFTLFERLLNNIKKLIFCLKFKYSNPYFFATLCSKPLQFRKFDLTVWYFETKTLLIKIYIEHIWFEISKFYNLKLQRYGGYKIKVWGKNSVPLKLLKTDVTLCINSITCRLKFS